MVKDWSVRLNEKQHGSIIVLIPLKDGFENSKSVEIKSTVIIETNNLFLLNVITKVLNLITKLNWCEVILLHRKEKYVV